jgi:hypothetical protein
MPARRWTVVPLTRSSALAAFSVAFGAGIVRVGTDNAVGLDPRTLKVVRSITVG